MDGARQIVANSFYLLLALSVMATVPLLVFRRQILFTFGCSEALWEYAEAYFTTYVSGTVFAVMSYGLNQITMSQGFSSTAMRSVMLGAAVNIALDPVFIFALNMGVRGAGARDRAFPDLLDGVYPALSARRQGGGRHHPAAGQSRLDAPYCAGRSLAGAHYCAG